MKGPAVPSRLLPNMGQDPKVAASNVAQHPRWNNLGSAATEQCLRSCTEMHAQAIRYNIQATCAERDGCTAKPNPSRYTRHPTPSDLSVRGFVFEVVRGVQWCVVFEKLPPSHPPHPPPTPPPPPSKASPESTPGFFKTQACV